MSSRVASPISSCVLVGVAKDRRPLIAVVAADALEDSGSVVKTMTQYVDLRLVPGDEIAALPDVLSLLHLFLLLGIGERRMVTLPRELREDCRSHFFGADLAFAFSAGKDVRGAKSTSKNIVDGIFDPVGRPTVAETVPQHVPAMSGAEP